MKTNTLLVIIIIMLIVFFGIFIIQGFTNSLPQEKKYIYFNRQNLTKFINAEIKAKHKEKIITFFDRYVGDYELTELIIDNARIWGIEYSTFFALIQTESSFKKTAEHKSTVGLCQLNLFEYPHYSKEYLFEPVNNLRLGAQHLFNDLLEAKFLELAIVRYNCGRTTNVPRQTIEYLYKILTFENIIFEDFAKIYCEVL